MAAGKNFIGAEKPAMNGFWAKSNILNACAILTHKVIAYAYAYIICARICSFPACWYNIEQQKQHQIFHKSLTLFFLILAYIDAPL